jgi:hypothetical protein
MFLRADLIPEEFLAQYSNKIFIASEGHVYARVQKGMYGLTQVGKVASNVLFPRL